MLCEPWSDEAELETSGSLAKGDIEDAGDVWALSIEALLTGMHAGVRHGDRHSVTMGLFGIGPCFTNALSSRLTVEVRRAGVRWVQDCERGVAVAPPAAVGPATGTGTVIAFQPDSDIFRTVAGATGRNGESHVLDCLCPGSTAALMDERTMSGQRSFTTQIQDVCYEKSGITWLGGEVMTIFEGSLAGRAAELAELSRLAESTLAGVGHAAFVVGEAGLGKTTVLEQAAAAARHRGLRVLQGSAQERSEAWPFALMSSCFRLEESPPDARRARVAEVLGGDARYGVPGAETEAAGAYAATSEAMIGLVEDLCAQEPLALFLDDLQWADSASVAMLHKLVCSVHQLPLLVVGAHRPVSGAGEVGRLSGSPIAGNRTLLELAQTPRNPSARPPSPVACSQLERVARTQREQSSVAGECRGGSWSIRTIRALKAG
ncbi:AAA family ATPase [Streptomyces sp. NPDC048045]|uniref:AAA family ATPase n=1 Tax=Streptomyces sp. NPDC048045 TaxID=3154710 RepID=UPI0034242689